MSVSKKKASFPCEYPGCKKTFTKKSNMKRHMMLHTGERPFHCDHDGCQKSFSRKSDLIVHMRRHSGLCPFTCTISGCKAAFPRKCDVATHVRKHAKDEYGNYTSAFLPKYQAKKRRNPRTRKDRAKKSRRVAPSSEDSSDLSLSDTSLCTPSSVECLQPLHHIAAMPAVPLVADIGPLPQGMDIDANSLVWDNMVAFAPVDTGCLINPESLDQDWFAAFLAEDSCSTASSSPATSPVGSQQNSPRYPVPNVPCSDNEVDSLSWMFAPMDIQTPTPFMTQ